LISSALPKSSSELKSDFSETTDRELDFNSVNVDSSTKALPVRDIPTTTMTTTTTGSWNLKNVPKFSRFLRGNVGSDWVNPFVVSQDDEVGRKENLEKVTSYKESDTIFDVQRKCQGQLPTVRTVPSLKYNHENKEKKKGKEKYQREAPPGKKKFHIF